MAHLANLNERRHHERCHAGTVGSVHSRAIARQISLLYPCPLLRTRARARVHARKRVRVYEAHASLVRTTFSRFYWRHAARLDAKEEEEEEMRSATNFCTSLHFVRVLLFGNNRVLLIYNILITNINIFYV